MKAITRAKEARWERAAGRRIRGRSVNHSSLSGLSAPFARDDGPSSS